MVLAAVAARTRRVRLGRGSRPFSQLQPWRLAHTLATLDQLSGGRVIFGAGLGVDREHEVFGERYERSKMGRKYDEALEIITRLWTGESVIFKGEFFTLDGVTLPVTPRAAASDPRSHRRMVAEQEGVPARSTMGRAHAVLPRHGGR